MDIFLKRNLLGKCDCWIRFIWWWDKSRCWYIVAGVDTSKFPKAVDLASLKSEIYKSFITKLETTPVDLSNLSEAVKNEVVKKTAYDELVWKVNANQNSNTVNLVKKAWL